MTPDSSCGTLECHLCKVKPASLKMWFTSFFSAMALCMLTSPPIKSSIYMLLSSSLAIGLCCSHDFKWVSITPPSKNGLGPRPNKARVKHKTRSSECSSSLQWNQRASRSLSQILTWRKAFCKSPVTVTGCILSRTKTFHSLV